MTVARGRKAASDELLGVVFGRERARATAAPPAENARSEDGIDSEGVCCVCCVCCGARGDFSWGFRGGMGIWEKMDAGGRIGWGPFIKVMGVLG